MKPFHITATTPNRILNQLLLELNLKSDKQLAIKLGYTNSSSICHVRQSRIDIAGTLILRIYDHTGWSIERIRDLAGIAKIDYERRFK
jgi:hypothetical protein